MLSRPSPLLRPPPTASRLPRHFPGSPVIDGHAPRAAAPGAEEALSSSHDNPLTVPRPLRRGVPRRPLQDPRRLPWPSPFHHGLGSPLVPLTEASVTTLVRLHMMLRTGQSLAPSQGLRRSASTAGSLPTPGAVLPGTLASPRTGLAPAGCRELLVQLRHDNLPAVMAPELLDARRNPKPMRLIRLIRLLIASVVPLLTRA